MATMEEDDENRWVPLVVSSMQMSVFGWMVWHKGLYAFLEAADCLAWVSQRLAKVFFERNNVPERSPA